MFKHQVKAVFFDLDGTLVDTAPDMALALNLQLKAHDKAPLAFEQIRPWVSHGAAALLKLGFQITPNDSAFAAYRDEYLKIYSENLAVESKLFSYLKELLEHFEKNQILWGVVTNKPEFLALPLLDALGIRDSAAAIVCGDTIKPTKPSPIPLFLACKQADLNPNQCIYVGDAKRDIQAAKSAGQYAIAAEYGYIAAEDDFENWNADQVVKTSQDLYQLFPASSSTG
ncbi:MAG: HAD-IA family hydrolase [Gammaproteobacteria bacterium]|nr:HAD-IA family hydrolase [Gammaproteobacteria bacterium]